ncbi:hypothetical protein QCA50_007814 [Cerrena zonata]|uniref:PhoD-like phosphatase domain-containing protein n=1 Tax=Cerrena zonata TaxID=2478898 RepID=A0AAW0G622_9APHY
MKKDGLNLKEGPDGLYTPVEPTVQPMQQTFVGGFAYPGAHSSSSTPPPPPPPKDDYTYRLQGPNGYKGSTLSQTESISSYATGNSNATSGSSMTYITQHMAKLSAVERSRNFTVARMNPHLQLMAGPLLRYDTVDQDGVWHGAALVVTADAGSVYEPYPTLTYTWDPNANAQPMHRRTFSKSTTGLKRGPSIDLGPHPADPYSTAFPTQGDSLDSPAALSQDEQGQELWVYCGNGGTFTFWRFMIHVPLTSHEMRVTYMVNHGQHLHFFVPARNQNMRWAAFSCNGFSAGVNPDEFRGPGFASGYDPVWSDLLEKHQEEPFHALVGGGDQLYCDAVIREPEMQEWVNTQKPDKRMAFQMTQEMAFAIDRFFFNHYCQVFRSGAFARANSSIPMVNMLDDHDLIDGFGSYPDELMRSPVFRTIGSRGYFFFLLFQCFINVDVDGTDERIHPFRSTVIGGQGPWVPFPSHSILSYMGPQVYLLALDCRAERKKEQVCSKQEYDAVFRRIDQLPSVIEHFVMLTGIPIAYPRMVFLETALESKFNPLVALGRNGSLGLSGFVNKFNADAELLDDLNDHWTAKSHKRERNWLIEQLQNFAKVKHARVSLLGGDVHCAAVGILKTLVKGKNKQDLPPAIDYRYMINVVSSAIVNTPPPNGVLTMVGTLATKTHRTLHHMDTDESMMPVFEVDTDGSAPKSKYIMGRRNWCSVTWDPASGDLVFDIRVEKRKGYGETVGYIARAPPPRWSP